MIFNKPFICLGNKKRGMARFYSLLKMFGQEFRLSDYYEAGVEKLFELPNVCFDKQRQVSIDFLNQALKI